MYMGDSHRHEKSKDSEAILGIYDILIKEKGEDGLLDPEEVTGDLLEVEEEGNKHSKQILSRKLQHNGTQQVSS